MLWYMLYLLSILSRVQLMFEGGSNDCSARWGRGGVSVYSAPDNAPVRASAAPAVLSATSLRDSRFCEPVWTKTAVHQ